MAVELEKLIVRILGDDTHFVAKMAGVNAVVAKTSAKIMAVGKAATLGMTVPIVAAAGLSIKAFSDFEDQMTKSTSIMGNLSSSTIQAMEEQAKALSGEGVQSADELAEAYFFLASAGLNAEQAIGALPIAQKFATAGAFDMATATDLLTDAQSALGLTVKDTTQNMENMTRMSDVLVKANTLANATVEQFSTALTSKAGAALKAYNKDVEEGVAVLAAMADQGIKAELAGNSLDRIMRLLAKSHLDNVDAHKQLGFSVFNSAGEMRNMADIVENLETVLAGMNDEQKVAALDMLGFEARVQAAILPLIGISGNIRNYEQELRKAGKTTEEVANKQMKSLAAQTKMAWNQIKTMGIEIGQELAPMFLDLLDYIKEGVKWFKDLSTAERKTLISNALLIASIGPMILIVGQLGFALNAVIAAAGLAKTAFFALGGALGVAQVAAIAFGSIFVAQVVMMLNGASAAYGRFNSEIQKFARLMEDMDANSNKRHRRTVQEISAINDQSKRYEALAKAVKKAKAELEGALGGRKQAESQFDLHNTGFKRMTGNKMLENARKDLERADQVVRTNRMRLEELESMKFDIELNRSKPGPEYPNSPEAKAVSNAQKLIQATLDETQLGSKSADQQAIDSTLEGLELQADTLGMTATQLAFYNLEKNKASSAEFEHARNLLRTIEAQEAAAKAQEDYKSAMDQGAMMMKRFATPMQKFKTTVGDLNDLLAIGAIDGKTYNAALLEAKETMDSASKQPTKFKVQFDGIEALESGTNAAIAKIAATRREAQQLRVEQMRRNDPRNKNSNQKLEAYMERVAVAVERQAENPMVINPANLRG
jgi:TP901 family phage tail tape measure protein